MKTKVYIDGQSGTTGLQINDRISNRDDLELLKIDDDKRHDIEERKKYLNMADVIEAVSLVENENVKIIDASTAHRTNDNWVYGYPELNKEQRLKIKQSNRVANPGCHATGLISTTAPLISMKILPPDYPLSCYSLTGYSGGGKKMIASYESADKQEELMAPGIYGLNLMHKHIPEMQKISGLSKPPIFMPIVDDYYKGMATTIMLDNSYLYGKPSAKEICDRLAEYYQDEHFVSVREYEQSPSTLYANTYAGTNKLEIVVCGHDKQTSITALFDNLGKGASGAAVQNMNIMLGLDETVGLE